jgi:hypothetical protein
MDTSTVGARAAEPSPRLLSPDEWQRLRFLAYLRRTGRLRPPATVAAEVDALCTALLRNPPSPPTGSEGPRAPYGGLPPLWRAWAEQQAQRTQQRI